MFDLGRGGDFGARPGPLLGAAAYDAANSRAVAQGAVGAGTGAGADGLARAVRPVHTMLDGDTTFALSVGHRASSPAGRAARAARAAADCVTRVVVHAVLAAESVRTPVGDWPSYRDLFPSSVC